MENIIKTYPCGLRMIVRPMAGFKSVATSVHVSVGGRNEQLGEYGISHVVEHMLFKGTEKRSAIQIAEELSGQGIDYNAYTSDVATCYHTKSLASNVETCCDVLSDMFFNLKFADSDLKSEIEVVIQEINMRDDNPRHALNNLSEETFFEGTDYGHSIEGEKKAVRTFKSADIYNYIKKHYTAPNTIISFAGDITLATAEALVKKYFLPNFKGEAAPNIPVIGDTAVAPKKSFAKRKKKIAQHNVVIMFPTVNLKNPDKYVLTFVNEILSSGMSSRLFSSVREKLGLVYTISGGNHHNDIGGYYYIWFACTPKNTAVVLKTVAQEVERIKADGVTEDEIMRVRNTKQAERLFEVEDVERINQRNVTQLSVVGEIETAEQYLEKINKVTASQIHEAAKKYLDYAKSLTCVVGPNFKK